MIVAAVLGGAILTEIVVQWVSRRGPANGAERLSRQSIGLSDPPEHSP